MRQSVAVRHHALHQTVESRGPSDDQVALFVLGMPAGEHFARNLVNGEAVHFSDAGPGVAGQSTLGAAETGHVAATDSGGQKAQQHLTFAETLGGLVRQICSLERVRRDESVGPHGQTSTGMLFQPHWKLDGGLDARLSVDVVSGTRLSHSCTSTAISRRAR